jgi:alpha-L-fucosidase
MTTQILSIVSELKGELYKLNSDISTKLLKLNDAKREYISDIKELFSHSQLSTTDTINKTHEKISSVLEKSNESLLNKTTLLMSEIIPKSNDKNYASIEGCIKQFFGSISEDTKALLKMNSGDKTDGLADDIDKNINKMFSNIQTALFNAIQASESRTFTNIQQIHENILSQKQIQENLSGETHEQIRRYSFWRRS